MTTGLDGQRREPDMKLGVAITAILLSQSPKPAKLLHVAIAGRNCRNQAIANKERVKYALLLGHDARFMCPYQEDVDPTRVGHLSESAANLPASYQLVTQDLIDPHLKFLNELRWLGCQGLIIAFGLDDMALSLFGAMLFVAYANGANDNFKGVATLFGSRTTDYRKALGWATITTLAGSGVALLLSGGLVEAFSGKGLVSDALAQDSAFLMAVGLGAAVTVMLATVTGFPISTTHALIGALVGAGLAAVGSVNLGQLGQSFFLPLAASPIISIMLTGTLYPLFHKMRSRLGIERQMCLCVDRRSPQPVVIQPNGAAILQASGIVLTVNQLSNCVDQYNGRLYGIDTQWLLDRLHFLSAGAVGFARGLNDTPKIVALLIAATALGAPLSAGMLAVGGAMAIGGLLSARKVAMTVSEGITPMNPGQGLTANMVTALLVGAASIFSLPVSTTHVSSGSLFGLGVASRQAHWPVIRKIVFSWLITLPLAAVIAAVVVWVVGA